MEHGINRDTIHIPAIPGHCSETDPARTGELINQKTML